MEMPKVSIIIPVYNGSNYLANAIDCSLRQTYRNLEVIVVNDGSRDDGKTEAVALSYGDRIRYFSKPNGGVSSALNFGIQQMTGQYFSWLSHDDAYSNRKVEDSVELLRSYDALGKRVLAFTGGYFIDIHGEKIRDFHHYFECGHLYSGLEVVQIMTRKGTLNGCCMLIPREAFEEAGYFHEALRYSQDSLMWYNIFLCGYGLVCDNRPNVMYRLHQNQASQLRRDLYEHDSLVIAKLLAKPMVDADGTGALLMGYIKRLTKYEASGAIQYMCDYAVRSGLVGLKERTTILMYRFFGFFRYRIVKYGKKLLIRFRH